ncbi:hypothetical protein [Intestinimonas butyriciproducens]|nr:hypothetical protein [Intestinimonas butyriciproducens]
MPTLQIMDAPPEATEDWTALYTRGLTWCDPENYRVDTGGLK